MLFWVDCCSTLEVEWVYDCAVLVLSVVVCVAFCGSGDYSEGGRGIVV